MNGALAGQKAGTTRYWDEMPWHAMPTGPIEATGIADGSDPLAAAPYDLLRTRAMRELSARRWIRIGLCQARFGAASGLTALNLALSESRLPRRNIVLVDLDFARQPIAGQLGIDLDHGTVLSGGGQASGLMGWRLANRLAFVTALVPTPEAAVRLLDPTLSDGLAEAIAHLDADLAILHVPPLLEGDAGIAAIPLLETLLLVIDGQADIPADLQKCQSMLGETVPLLGLFHHDAEV